ncbi:MAG: Iron hydrogenase 1 [Syntrophomonadaceae bacterium]|nr:Iron hydrogenase 1 [Bacillota bacterium]
MGVVSTNTARCHNCYRCVRTCPVKAIRVISGQAEVVDDLCIACATCVRACPQKAKIIRDDLPSIKLALAAGRTVVASVAPSMPAYFEMTSFSQMEKLLAVLGFAAAGETAFGAEMVALAHQELAAQDMERWPIITSSCPVVNELVEKYYPDLIPHLAPIVSPMTAHGRYLHQQYGDDVFTVFIGPCIAKKDEMVDEAVTGVVDAVLTFTELERWMQEVGVVFPAAQPGVRGQGSEVSPHPAPPTTDPRQPTPHTARLFPLEGGLVGTAQMDTDVLSSHNLIASGITTCRNVLEGIRSGALEACLVELMACEGGCINGPALMNQESVALARQRVIAYSKCRQPQPLPIRNQWPSLERIYRDRHTPIPEFTEEQIQEVLHRVEKYSPEDELDCGACGYDSCRQKATAVLRGMAEATMCIPYMRTRAESLTNVVMDVTPNAVLVMDKSLHLQDISRSAEQMFHCHRLAVRGKPLRELIPIVEDFLIVRDTGQPLLRKIVRLRDDLRVIQNIMPVGGENLMVAILSDVTETEQHREEMERLRAETLQRTQEVINKQMRVAHEIAGLLGETTAETKTLLTRLKRLMEESQDQ